MNFSVKIGAADTLASACVVAGVTAPHQLSPAAKQLDKASGGQLSALLKRGDVDTECAKTTLLHNPKAGIKATRVLLVGCGQERILSATAFIKIAYAVAETLQTRAITEAVSSLAELEVEGQDLAWKVQQLVIACRDAVYRFDELKSKPKAPKHPLQKLTITLSDKTALAAAKKAVAQGIAIANGVDLARVLGNRPGNLCTPSDLVDQAKMLKKRHPALTFQILQEKEMQKLGMGALLSVSHGSRQAAKLIVMHYKGSTAKPVVLVGKGITFDSGGISLKPGAAMDEMKFDMCGAASVFGVMSAAAELKLAINLVGIVPAAENMPDGNASRPGDIVTSMSGQTIEILNTDAEGRLILCDALWYAKKFKPEVVVDIATLTGACVVALGQHAMGLLSNDQALADALLDAGQRACDRAWQLPLWDEYDEQLASNFADMANIGGREAGTITAACFLARFTKDYRWAHLDIAGVAWKTGKNKGATGRPVPLLMEFLMQKSTKTSARKQGSGRGRASAS